MLSFCLLALLLAFAGEPTLPVLVFEAPAIYLKRPSSRASRAASCWKSR